VRHLDLARSSAVSQAEQLKDEPKRLDRMTDEISTEIEALEIAVQTLSSNLLPADSFPSEGTTLRSSKSRVADSF
jgi:hypothetical protein